MPYLGRTLGQGTRSRFLYTATAGQTTFSGSDTQSNTLAYADNNGVDCFQNGVLLKGGGADYTATTGTSVVLTTGASVNDIIEIMVYDVFAIADHVKKSGDAMTGALTNIDVNGTELILDADGDTSIEASTDDTIDIKIAGNDQVVITTGSTAFKAPDGGNRYALNGMGNSNSAELSLYDSSDAQKVRIGTGADTFFNGGNVGIGTNSPTAKLAVSGTGTVDLGIGSTNAGGAYLYLDGDSNGDFSGSDYSYIGHDTSGQLLIHQDSPSGSDNILFKTNATERMRIDSSGNILVGTSDSADTSGVGCKFRNTGALTGTFNTSNAGTSGFHYYNTNGTYNGYRFYVRADGGVYNYSSANYNLSDEREKKNIADMGSHYEDFKKFKFRDFNYNTEEDSQPKKHGVIAQEVELVNSNLVGEDFKVKVDEDGKDVLRKGLKEEQFVMIGLKTLQETIVKLEGALARIETLEAKVTALEGKP